MDPVKNLLLPKTFLNLPTVTSQFVGLQNRSGFGDSSGNKNTVFIINKNNNNPLYALLMVFIVLSIFIFGIKSIPLLCPGQWNTTHWLLLLIFIATGGNIGLVYIIMAYLLKMKIC